jgi:polycystin 2
MGIVLNLMWVKMLKYLTRHKAFSKLGRTIAAAGPTLAALTMFFIITIIGYSIAYLLIIGVEHDDYANLTSAFWSIVRSLMGDYEYEPVARANVVLGPLLYWSWQMLCQIIFLNLIIAAFCEEFAKILMRVRSAPFFLCGRCDKWLNLNHHPSSSTSS